MRAAGCLFSKARASWRILKSGLEKRRPGVLVQTLGHSLPETFGVLSGASGPRPPFRGCSRGSHSLPAHTSESGRALEGTRARMAQRPARRVGAGPQDRGYRPLGVGSGLKPFLVGSLWAEPGGLSVPRRHEINPRGEKRCDLDPTPYNAIPERARPVFSCLTTGSQAPHPGPGLGRVAQGHQVRTAGPASSKASEEDVHPCRQSDGPVVLWAAP